MRRLAGLLAGALFWLGWCAPALAEAVAVELQPDEVRVGLAFRGQEVRVTGRVPEGSDVYVRVSSSPGSTVNLDRKGRVGPLWMNVEHVWVEGMPRLYQVFTSAPLSGLTPDLEERLGIDAGFRQVGARARVWRREAGVRVPLAADKADEYKRALTDIYLRRGLYGVQEGAIRVEADGRFAFTLAVPRNVPQSDLEVEAYAVRGGALVGTGRATLGVRSVGVVGWARREAAANGVFYGIVSVVIALVSGLAVAAAFQALDRLGARRPVEARGTVRARPAGH
ncbi:MAG: TIGR02186 family protein [Firmicutes bacterium]|nr:TIGR02186 family protein [Bacillota bacterium]